MHLSRIALRDAAILSLTIFGIGAVVGAVVYFSAGQALKHEVQQNLLSLAKSAANLTDARSHTAISKPEDKGNADYERVRKPYYALLHANPDLAFIYTNIERDGKLLFIIDSSIPKPGQKDIPTDVLQEYTDASPTLQNVFRTRKAAVENETYTDDWGTFLSAYAPIFDGQTFIGTVGVDIRVDAYLARMSRLRMAVALGLVIALIASMAAGLVLYSHRSRGLLAAAQAERQAEELQRMQQERLDTETQAARAHADRQKTLRDAVDNLKADLNQVLASLDGAAEHLNAHAQEVSESSLLADERTSRIVGISTASADLSDRIARSTQELATSIHEISAQSEVSRGVAEDAARQADVAASALLELSEKSEKVGEVTGLITEIAGQINLLALNATIESARAGDAGRGFAVVATEVKNLSTRVTIASQEISRQIGEVQRATTQSVKAVDDIRATVVRVLDSAQLVAAAVSQQRSATSEIDLNVSESVRGTHQITEDLVDVEKAMKNTGRSAAFVHQAASSLRSETKQMKDRLERFAEQVA